MEKMTIRKALLEQRESISEINRGEKSKAISALIHDSESYKKAKNIFCFISVSSEPDTSEIIKVALSSGKTICVPRTKSEHIMEAVPITETEYKAVSDWPHRFGIPEPPDSIKPIDPLELDLVVVPSIATDIFGYRLGYGGGYYDAFINKYQIECKRPTLVAILFSEFLLEEALPREAHDKSVDFIVTENDIIIPFSCA